ncbi:unnamed protein product [Cladocopium goreaui]|uniref:Protein kinase domain-containing protein n=1 Tax=Cladocopium goreaui TaxID=2562237 RepID=A0A9P1FYE6_9DINO|nr:unnamed protein product [Cladocopium goreaui]
MEVHHVFSEAEVTKFLRRLQIEAKDNQHFLRFRDAVLSLPGQLGIVEEMHQVSLWKDLERCDDAALARAACALRCGLSGLARLHSLGWLLCVSHENFCLTYDGVWKLCGLHLARPTHQVEMEREKLGRHLLPEVLFELPLSEKLDIWSGITACHRTNLKAMQDIFELHILPMDAPWLEHFRGPVLGLGLVSEEWNTTGPKMQSLGKRYPSQYPGAKVVPGLKAEYISSGAPGPHVRANDVPILELGELGALQSPEGQLLRRAGGELEAIEPVGGLFRAHHGLRPKRIFEALKKLQAHQIILGALDLLLQVDPQERPSAAEALKSDAVRRLDGLEVPEREDALDEPPASQPSTKCSCSSLISETCWLGFGQETEGYSMLFVGDVKEASPSQSRHRASRKGTGFVSPDDLPHSDEEDDEVQSAPAQASSQRHVGFGQDVKEASPSQSRHRASRKGTGFVSPDDLPHSDEEDNEAQPATSSRHVGFDKVQSAPAQASSQRHVGFGQETEGYSMLFMGDVKEASPSQSRHRASRKGTGFVSPDDLPPSDEEDNEAQPATSSRHVGFDKDVDKTRKKLRLLRSVIAHHEKAVQFLCLCRLKTVQSAPAQASSQRHVGFGQETEGYSMLFMGDVKEASPSQSRHRASRKGTGFVSPDDLPPSDEEDDEAQPATSSRHVGFDKDVDKTRKKLRLLRSVIAHHEKAVQFLCLCRLKTVQSAPAQASSQRHVGFGQETEGYSMLFMGDVKEASPSQSRHRASRKGTGFVSPDDLPHSDEEDNEAQPATSSRHVGFDKDAQEASPSQKRHSASRKGTGFVAPADLPLSDDEDEQATDALA